MKNYLSFGGGVNSVALYFLLKEQGIEFEAVYVDHGCDWPETREYVRQFAERFPLTIINPNVRSREGKIFNNLFDYCYFKRVIPSVKHRWCTERWKVKVIEQYVEKPCFVLLGIDAGESHRARIGSNNGMENRYPLIEAGINREKCKDLIRKHGYEVPQKSGCFFCPYQRITQIRRLRYKHPDLICKIRELESRVSKKVGRPFGLFKVPIDALLQE